jgi:hypothetical protein
MQRREALSKLQKLFFGLALFGSPYASALEHIDNLQLSTTPDPLQKRLIETNIEFQLAIEDASGDPCAIKWAPYVTEKNKCYSSGDA